MSITYDINFYQLYKHSVDIEEAKRAQHFGDVRRECEVYKAHLQDLFYNKAQLITLLNKEKVGTLYMQ